MQNDAKPEYAGYVIELGRLYRKYRQTIMGRSEAVEVPDTPGMPR